MSLFGGSRERVVTGDACLALFAPIYEFSRSPISLRHNAERAHAWDVFHCDWASVQETREAWSGTGESMAGLKGRSEDEAIARTCIFPRFKTMWRGLGGKERAFYPWSLTDQAVLALSHLPRLLPCGSAD